MILAVNHALVSRSWFINQDIGPVSLEIKDTEVRAYRTDPVQVRSCSSLLSLGYIYNEVFYYSSDVGVCAS
ncbi:hypothetical protein Bca52824_057875 [Brassica carinata]|uniref:Uncharacterized protein n=1 Tax=Brassica carinata TaxID=52824 RepID=A0A8X7QVF6_BRACI|nr:hypothetical protein Bca52824_057875 [Brassica carinata]